ncbi:hypothetical protein D3C80_1588210 [compost metagenome]
MAFGFALAVKGLDRNVRTVLDFTLHGRIFAGFAAVHIGVNAELGGERQTTSNKRCRQQRAAKKRARYRSADSSENHEVLPVDQIRSETLRCIRQPDDNRDHPQSW